MYKYIIILLMICTVAAHAGQKYFTREGHIHFVSHTEIIDLMADNFAVNSFLDTDKGTIAMALLMKSFEFEHALAEEHFNENYVESHKYPKAKFKGKITNPEDVKFDTDGKYKVTVKGKLTMHGITRDITAKGTLTVEGQTIKAVSRFSIKLSDYGMTIPGVVRDKVSETIKIKVKMTYWPYKK